MSNNEEFYRARILALETENKRLNDEIREVKTLALKIRISDPNFDKPLNQIEVNYEQVTNNIR